MTRILEVDTEALNRLAERIRSAAEQSRTVAGEVHGGVLHASIGGLGTPALIRAAGSFVESWAPALAELVADANRLADAISLLARSYQDAESAAARSVL